MATIDLPQGNLHYHLVGSSPIARGPLLDSRTRTPDWRK
jgi:hypothetical protein